MRTCEEIIQRFAEANLVVHIGRLPIRGTPMFVVNVSTDWKQLGDKAPYAPTLKEALLIQEKKAEEKEWLNPHIDLEEQLHENLHESSYRDFAGKTRRDIEKEIEYEKEIKELRKKHNEALKTEEELRELMGVPNIPKTDTPRDETNQWLDRNTQKEDKMGEPTQPQAEKRPEIAEQKELLEDAIQEAHEEVAELTSRLQMVLAEGEDKPTPTDMQDEGNSNREGQLVLCPLASNLRGFHERVNQIKSQVHALNARLEL